MSDEHLGSRLTALLRTLKPKTKEPVSTKVLNTWIAQAEGKLGDEARGGRLGWLIASSVAIAAVQRAIDTEGRQPFLLKGGTLLQHRLNATARTTKDVDGLIRGDLDEFILALDEALDEHWGPLTLRRGGVEVVNVPTKIIKPRRFDIILELRGVTWRRVQFEASPDEARVSDEQETIEPPPLSGFGLPDPDLGSQRGTCAQGGREAGDLMVGKSDEVLYSAAKGGLIMLAKGAAIEWAPSNIRVNVVAPGLTATPIIEASIQRSADPETYRREREAQIPLQRLATPEEVADAILFLASSESSYITGAVLPVDGGYTAF